VLLLQESVLTWTSEQGPLYATLILHARNCCWSTYVYLKCICFNIPCT